MSLERFTGATVSMRLKIPFEIKNQVSIVFKNEIRYEKGITTYDAYFHCIQKAIQLFDNDPSVFNGHYLTVKTLKEDDTDSTVTLRIPQHISESITRLTEYLYTDNKRVMFIQLVGIGLKIYESEI